MLIYYLVLGVLVVAFVLRKLFGGRYSSIGKTNYSWWEILWIFNAEPRKIYNHLSPENKGAFWSVTSSVLLGIITCWLGFSLQFFVYNSSQTESSKLAHYQVIDKFRPMYLELYDSISTPVLKEIMSSLGYLGDKNEKLTSLSESDYLDLITKGNLSDEKINTAEGYLATFILNKKNEPGILYTSEKFINMASNIAPYLDAKKNSKVLSNNSKIFYGTQLLYLINDSLTQDSITFVKNAIYSYNDAMIKQYVGMNMNVAKFCELEYGLYKNIRQFKENSKEYKVAVSQLVTGMILIPLFENNLLITGEFAPYDTTNKIMFASILILILSMLIGWIIFRILIMKFFDRKSLEPNPRMSQTDLDKVLRVKTSTEKENQQLNTNIITLESSLKDLRAELKKQQGDYVKKEEQLKETIAELEKQQKFFERKERNFRETINDLESQKKDLFEQIEELKSSLNVLRSTSEAEETENMEEKESI